MNGEWRSLGTRDKGVDQGAAYFPPLKVIIVFICMCECLCMCVPSCVEARGPREGDFEEEVPCVGENMKA